MERSASGLFALSVRRYFVAIAQPIGGELACASSSSLADLACSWLLDPEYLVLDPQSTHKYLKLELASLYKNVPTKKKLCLLRPRKSGK
jgi:hypothetical protein